jgi:hypothetical protein
MFRFYRYTGRMPFSGELLRNKFHAHSKIFREATFYAATPEELGLTASNGLKPKYPYETINYQEKGYSSDEDLRAFLESNLERAAKEYDQRIQTTGKSGYNLHQEEVSRERPRAICQGASRLEEVDGFFYDRREPTCCVPWSVQEGDIFTVVGFNRKMDAAVGPWTDKRPLTFPGHIGWWITVASPNVDPPKSQFGIAMYSHEPNNGFNPYFASPSRLVETLLSRGTPARNVLQAGFTAPLLFFVIRHRFVVFGLVVLLIGLGCNSLRRPRLPPTKATVAVCPDPESLVITLTSAITHDHEAQLKKTLMKTT